MPDRPLIERLRPCGPVIDAGLARRLDEVALDLDLRERARPVLAAIAGASPYLLQLMRIRPASLARTLQLDPAERVAEITRQAEAEDRDVASRLRGLKADLHLAVALADLGGVWGLDEVTGALTGFADAALRSALRAAAGAEQGRGRLHAPAEEHDGLPGLFVLAMGKHGAGELNYSSDIDISFFYDPARLPVAEGADPAQVANRITQSVSALLSERTAQGYVFRTDLRLRPDPAATPPAMPVSAALTYYETVGQNWERAAFIKARVAAGDAEVGDAFLRELRPFIWRRSLDYAAIADIHSIKRQILAGAAESPIKAAGCDLKRGRGGIREIEFYVQTQQLILGGRNPGLRSSRTVDALLALMESGYVAEDVAQELTECYARLRAWEHRVQMVADEQTHRMPADDDARRAIAALSGFDDLRRFDRAVTRTLQLVDRRYAELFAAEEPLSSPLGSLVFTGVENDPETLATLQRMGFTEAAQVSETIRAWHHGRIRATRTPQGRELFTRLTPRLLEAARRTGAPDAAFARFAAFFSGLSAGVQVQSLFLAEPAIFEQLVEVLAFAPEMARTLSRHPGALEALLDARFREPLEMSGAGAAVAAALGGVSELEGAMATARRVAREQRFRIGLQILTGSADPLLAGAAYTDLADACVRALAPLALTEIERRGGAFPGAVAVLALGTAGSREMTARSDLDLLILYHAEPGSASAGQRWRAETVYGRFAQQLISALSSPTAEGVLYAVDMRLRPSGPDGPLAVSLPGLEAYYGREAETWELMALTRARVIWASDQSFAEDARLVLERLLGPARDGAALVRDVREMRALLHAERISRGTWDLKHAPGGLIDIEFAAQTLSLAAAGRRRGPEVLEILEEDVVTGVAPRRSWAALAKAWRLQQGLVQLLKVALDEGSDPSGEPGPYQAKLAGAGGSRSFRALEAKLARTQMAAHRAYLGVLRATERGL